MINFKKILGNIFDCIFPWRKDIKRLEDLIWGIVKKQAKDKLESFETFSIAISTVLLDNFSKGGKLLNDDDYNEICAMLQSEIMEKYKIIVLYDTYKRLKKPVQELKEKLLEFTTDKDLVDRMVQSYVGDKSID